MSLEKIKVYEVTEYKPSSLTDTTYGDICADFIKGNEVCITVNEYRATANDAVAKMIDYVIYAVCNYVGANSVEMILDVTDTIAKVLGKRGIVVGKMDRPTQLRFSINDHVLKVKARYL